MSDEHRKRLAWIASNILPHEGGLARRLKRVLHPSGDVHDVIQEAYCRVMAAPDLERIANPRAYFFKIAMGIAIDQLRRTRVVPMDMVADIEALNLMDEGPSPERTLASRGELQLVRRFLEGLPERCRTVLEMRKVEGLSQKEIARQLGVSENVVENEAKRGLRLLLEHMAEREISTAPFELVRGGRRARLRD